MKEQMDRDTLLIKICPWDRTNDCCEGTSDFHCEDCAQLMDEWLDEYDKQIRAKAIDDCKELTFREVVYCDSLNDRTEFRELAEQLKAGGNNVQKK